MEDDLESKSENANESQKLLYKYQYAFLHMQKSFTSMFKVIHVFEQRKSFRCLNIWKLKTLPSPQSLTIQLSLFCSKLRYIESRLRKSCRLKQLSYFCQIIKASEFKKRFSLLKTQFKQTNENNYKELQIMEREVSNLRKSQNELENITRNYSKRELGLKSRIDSLNGKSSYEWLVYENKSLKLQIDEIDKKSFAIFKEFNLILDELEELKRKKVKKMKKKSKVVIKGRHILPISV